ncbi:MAG: UUP1 family membrane protein [Myxococcota bacterium]
MSRATAITGLLLVALGLCLLVWKALVLGIPTLPSRLEGLWSVELEVDARGRGRGSIRVPMPSSEDGQVVFDEHTSSDRLLFTVRTEGDQRTGVWSGRFSGMHEIVHGFRVELSPVQAAIPPDPIPEPPAFIRERYGEATAVLPAAAPEIREVLATLRLPSATDPAGRTRMLFGFVSDEIAPVSTGSDHALLTLGAREGRPEGRTRLLVTLLRAAGVPARPVLGLALRSDATLASEAWAEAWLAGQWVPMSPDGGFFAHHPEDLLVLRTGSLERIDSTGVEAVGYRYRARRETLRPEELAALMIPDNPFLAEISLYRLPLATQGVLRALLLLPLGALVIGLLRNVAGIPTFGTFMPILIAFTLRGTSLGLGLGMVAIVIGLGIAGRLVLERLRLLLVPRLAILLCLVVLSVTALALLGEDFGRRDLTGAVLFPMVILTMLVERFSVSLAEEGARTALVRAGYSLGVAVLVYPLFRSSIAEHLMFTFPELVVSIIGLLVLMGGYTGYRLSDLVRFRFMASTQEPETP